MIMGKWISEDPGNTDELERKGISYYESDDDVPCIGVDVDIKDDETWGAYKARVAKTLTDGGIPSEPKDIRLCHGSYNC